MKRTGPTTPELKSIIQELKKCSQQNESLLWKKVAKELEKSTRQRRKINLFQIEKYSKDGDTIIVPGKVLATGELTKKVKVAAWNFSESAQEKLKETITIQELMKKNPKGNKIKILC